MGGGGLNYTSSYFTIYPLKKRGKNRDEPKTARPFFYFIEPGKPVSFNVRFLLRRC
jgi:hypothetical protein